MKDLRVDIGGSNRGFQLATEDTKRLARDLQRSLDSYTPDTFKGAQMMRDKYGKMFDAVAGQGSSTWQKINSLTNGHAQEIADLIQKYGKLGGLVGGLGSIFAGAWSDMGKAHELSRQAESLGVSATFFKGFGGAASRSGMDAGDAQQKLYRMTDKVGSAAEGDKGALNLFKDMGVQVEGRTMEQVILDIAKAFEKMENPAQRAHKAVELFGRGGQMMLPVMKELANSQKRSGATDDAFLNLFNADDAAIAIEASAYKSIKNGVNGAWKKARGLWSNMVASGLGALGFKGDAPEVNKIEHVESSEEKAQKEQQAKQQAKSLADAQAAYRSEVEATADAQTRVLMLLQDEGALQQALKRAQAAKDEVEVLKISTELLRKRKDLTGAKADLKKEYDEKHKSPELVKKESGHVDSLSSMGLISSAGAMTNPVLDVSRKQLTQLQKIAENTKPKKDPFAP